MITVTLQAGQNKTLDFVGDDNTVYDGLPPGVVVGSHILNQNNVFVAQASPYSTTTSFSSATTNWSMETGSPSNGLAFYYKYATFIIKNGAHISRQANDSDLSILVAGFSTTPLASGNSVSITTRQNNSAYFMSTFFQEESAPPYAGPYTGSSLNVSSYIYYQKPYWKRNQVFNQNHLFYWDSTLDNRPVLYKYDIKNTLQNNLNDIYGDYTHYTIYPKRSVNPSYDQYNPIGQQNGIFLGYVYRKQVIRIVAAQVTPISGCTNPIALNYNPAATVDDGSCIFPTPTGSVTPCCELSSGYVSPVTNYATILSSVNGLKQVLGTGIKSTQASVTLANSDPDALASSGVVTLIQKRPGEYTFHKGRTTLRNSNPSSISSYRGVCRSLIPSLYQSIGNTAQVVHALAEKAVKQSFLDAIDRGCPILDYTSTVSVVGQSLIIDLDYSIADQIDGISASISIDLD